jgi:DNA-binding transcriptional regulator GbsR (MarR family)
MHISLDGVFERGAGRPSPTSVLVTLRGRARPLASDGPATDLIHDQGVSVSRISIDIRLLSSDISVMTEITAKKKLPAAVERFVLHWGDMGDEWGVNRSVSQIHGLLYLSETPVTADDIAETLGMARSNVSNSIRELLSWNLIRRVPIMGDRRDHYEAETDIWEVAARIAAGRKEREIDPAVDALRACVVDAADDPTISPVASKRLKEMLAFTELVDRWYAQMLTVPRPRLIALIKLGEKIVSFLPAGKSK